jgi:ubiquinone/menaquinone biosynthesis C-methylase UbiE
MRESLDLTTIEGDMTDLSMFGDQTFDVIVHPVSNIFVADVQPIWTECFRVLRCCGVLMSGLTNPAVYLFDYKLADEKGILQVKYNLPYSDVNNLEE